MSKMIIAAEPRLDIIRSGLVLWLDASLQTSYPASGTTWSDLSGNGNNVALVNGPTYNTDNGGAIVFDGVNDYGQIDTAPINISTVSTSPFTISAYIRISAWETNNSFQILSIGTGDYNSANFQILTSKLTFIADTNAAADWNIGSPTAIGTTNLSLNTWYFLTVTRTTAGVYTVYINTTSNGAVTNTGNLTLNNQTLRIMSHYALNTEYMANGRIAALYMYNYALTSTEITHNFNQTRSRFGI